MMRDDYIHYDIMYNYNRKKTSTIVGNDTRTQQERPEKPEVRYLYMTGENMIMQRGK